MNNKVEDIKNKFIFEAKQSPLLFSDLANMEKYISESYIGRSLIELVQNADDAGASSFLYQKIDKETFIVANNGRPFSIDDLYSLCRSGASSKKRSNNNIGYRGIGFKSVVNYATEVHLISSDISVTFSRKLTKEAIGTNEPVPLIRVPNKFSGNKYNSAINSILNEGYSTLFIFEVSNSDIENEISVFEDSTLLFLKNIKKIDFNKKLIINLEDKNQISDNLYFSTINNGIEKNNWLTYTKNISSISFKIRDNEAVPILSNDPSIYVFMRTNEKFSIPIKINGDFTTDPSRTKIVNDEFTNKEIVKYYCNKNNKENLSKDLKEAIEYSIKKLYYDPADLVSDLDTKFESSEIPQVLIEAFADDELNDREFREAVYKYATEIGTQTKLQAIAKLVHDKLITDETAYKNIKEDEIEMLQKIVASM